MFNITKDDIMYKIHCNIRSINMHYQKMDEIENKSRDGNQTHNLPDIMKVFDPLGHKYIAQNIEGNT